MPETKYTVIVEQNGDLTFAQRKPYRCRRVVEMEARTNGVLFLAGSTEDGRKWSKVFAPGTWLCADTKEEG